MEALKLQPVITAFSVFGVFVCIVLTYYALVNLFKSFPRIRSKKDKEAIMDEDADAHHHVETYTGEPNIKLFWWVFLASDCMFFGSLITAYLIYKGQSLVGPYPLDVFDMELTTISTFILLLSSFFMVLTLSSIQKGDLGKFRFWCFSTFLCGLTFLGFQVYEFEHFIHEGLRLKTNLFGSTFYLLTGTHGVHVAIGVLWLLGMFIYSFWGGITKERAIEVEIAGLYWHFVDVVWIVIFSVIYLMELPIGG
tara:strand:- start:1901 stop:2653 length:753 start_codon:yes stop_codon:yes gene_type:complete